MVVTERNPSEHDRDQVLSEIKTILSRLAPQDRDFVLDALMAGRSGPAIEGRVTEIEGQLKQVMRSLQSPRVRGGQPPSSGRID